MHCVVKTINVPYADQLEELDSNRITIIVNGTNPVTVEKVVIYPYGFDFALVKTKAAIRSAVPLCLPEIGTPTFINFNVTVAGWGSTGSDVPKQRSQCLKVVEQRIFTKDECDKEMKKSFGKVLPWHICFSSPSSPNNRDGICYGDSGGPVMARVDGSWTLAGIISGGTNSTCGSGLGLAVDTTRFITFITNTIT